VSQDSEGRIDMHTSTVPTVSQGVSKTITARPSRQDDTVETQLWIDEHDWLHAVLKSPHNVSPTFRFPDLISACIALVFAEPQGKERIFGYLGKELVLRDPRTPRRREYVWRDQFELLRGLQLSLANRHPNPMFQLDQLTTACVALARRSEAASARVLQQARINMAHRSAHPPEERASG
jgi:hypothetical protein